MISTNVSLKSRNGMRVEATAKKAVEVRSLVQARKAIDHANKNGLPLLVLGQGSNTLFAGDWEGMVIFNRIRGLQVLNQDQRELVLRVRSGVNWHGLVKYCIKHDWYGLENLALIPGYVGAAPIQNIGAYGVELSNVVEAVEYLHFDQQRLVLLSAKECNFSYRESIFKQDLAGKGMVVAVRLRLQKQFRPELSYQGLKQLADEFDDLKAKHVFERVCALRRQKLPQDLPNLGSFFKNPRIEYDQYKKLSKRFPDIVAYEDGDKMKLAAAWMIEACDWKGREQSGVKVSDKHALVLMNVNLAKGKDVLRVAQDIQAKVKAKFVVSLQIEPQIYGSLNAP